MGKHQNISGGAPALPLTLLAQAIPMLSRNDLEALTERLIDVLDEMDGEIVESNGDELDGSSAEDDYQPGWDRGFPGCPISDPDMAIDDEGCDDIDQEREPEDERVAEYGIDQTAYWKGRTH